MGESDEVAFLRWKADVDFCLRRRLCGLDSRDLADQPYRDWFDDMMTPLQAAERAISRETGQDD